MDAAYEEMEQEVPESNFEKFGPRITRGLREELHVIRSNPNPNIGIRDYQIEAALKTKVYFENQLRPYKPALIEAPTGSGKSGIVALLPYVLESKKVLILSPSMIISRQLAEDFGYYPSIPSFFRKTSMKCVEKPNFLEHVTLVERTSQVLDTAMSNLVIVNAQKFSGSSHASLTNQNAVVVENVKHLFKPFDTLIVDEAHHYPAPTWKAVVDNFKSEDGRKKIIFLTATPFRKNGERILPKDTETYCIKPAELEGKTIRKSKFTEIPSNPPNSFECDVMFVNGLLTLLRNYLDRHDAEEPEILHQAMILVQLRDEATNLAYNLNKLLAEETFACAVTGDADGERNTKRFVNGDFRVAIVCKKLLEGFNNPNVSVCVIIRNLRSRVLFSQFIGRCLRISKLPNGGVGDKIVAQIISFQRYEQQKMWNSRNTIAEEDPEEEAE